MFKYDILEHVSVIFINPFGDKILYIFLRF